MHDIYEKYDNFLFTHDIYEKNANLLHDLPCRNTGSNNLWFAAE